MSRLKQCTNVSVHTTVRISGLHNLFEATSNRVDFQKWDPLCGDIKYSASYLKSSQAIIFWFSPTKQSPSSSDRNIWRYEAYLSAYSASGLIIAASNVTVAASDSWKTGMTLPKALLDKPRFQQVKVDDAIIVQIELRAAPIARIMSPGIRNLLHKSLFRVSAGDVTFVTFARRQPSGALQSTRDLHVDVHILEDQCPRLHAREPLSASSLGM